MTFTQLNMVTNCCVQSQSRLGFINMGILLPLRPSVPQIWQQPAGFRVLQVAAIRCENGAMTPSTSLGWNWSSRESTLFTAQKCPRRRPGPPFLPRRGRASSGATLSGMRQARTRRSPTASGHTKDSIWDRRGMMDRLGSGFGDGACSAQVDDTNHAAPNGPRRDLEPSL